MKHPIFLAAAAALIAWTAAKRKQRSSRELALAGVIAAVLILVGVGVIPLPNIEKIIEKVGTTLGPWTYPVVGLFAYLETGAFIGFVAPGETVVLVGGVVAGQGEISLVWLIAVVWSCAVAGDLTSYALGKKLGRQFLERHGPKIRITEERLNKVEEFFQRRGAATILVGRFLGLVRPLAPFLAGASHMPLRRFVPYDVVAAGAWSTLFCVLGYVFWQSLDQVTKWVGTGALLIGVLVAIGVLIWFVRKLGDEPEYRAQVEAWIADKPGGSAFLRTVKPVWARVRGPVQFVVERFTPGELGLEVTTLLALGGIGLFAYVALGQEIDRGGAILLDAQAFDVVDAIRTRPLTDVLKTLTDLGSSPVTGAVVALTALWAARRGRFEEALALPVAFVLVLVAVHLGKVGFDRPRPVGRLIEPGGMSYPSGHAAYAVAWIASAVVLVRAGWGIAVRFAAVTVALAIAVFVAFTRVYLHAHYLSDVAGGQGLSVAIFALVGVVAVFARHLRHNGSDA